MYLFRNTIRNNGPISILEKCSVPATYKLYKVFLLEKKKQTITGKRVMHLENQYQQVGH